MNRAFRGRPITSEDAARTATRLERMRIDETSLVDRPANLCDGWIVSKALAEHRSGYSKVILGGDPEATEQPTETSKASTKANIQEGDGASPETLVAPEIATTTCTCCP